MTCEMGSGVGLVVMLAKFTAGESPPSQKTSASARAPGPRRVLRARVPLTSSRIATLVSVATTKLACGAVRPTRLKASPAIRSGFGPSVVAVAIDHLLHPAAWGTLDTRALPAGSAVLVGGVAYDGGDLAVGPAAVEIRAPGRAAVSLTLQVLAGDTNVLQLPAEDPAPVAPTADGVHPGLIVAVAGAATAVAGAIVFSVGELAFLEAESQIDSADDDLPGEPLDDAAFMANLGLGVIAVGVVAGVVGGVLAVSAE